MGTPTFTAQIVDYGWDQDEVWEKEIPRNLGLPQSLPALPLFRTDSPLFYGISD